MERTCYLRVARRTPNDIEWGTSAVIEFGTAMQTALQGAGFKVIAIQIGQLPIRAAVEQPEALETVIAGALVEFSDVPAEMRDPIAKRLAGRVRKAYLG